MILNRQRQYALRRLPLEAYVRRLKRQVRLGRREFNICLVGDQEITRLNAAYLGRHCPTDVLAFPWQEAKGGFGSARPPRIAGRTLSQRGGHGRAAQEFRDFLGDVMISVETARRNARSEGHSTLHEIRRLILHGVLHLLGYDHERDQGEMIRCEHALREQLRIARPRGRPQARK